MRHLILCPEYPPAPIPTGGIGTYVFHISRLLAAAGETVHIIGQLWPGAPKELEVFEDGRLIIHRIPSGDRDFLNLCHPNSLERIQELEGLHTSSFPPQSFSWQACHLAESLVINEGIDVIEAQEYEAPLYYFQLRRALGWGPQKKPPCFVHLHSPTKMIAQYNDADSYHPYFLTAGRLEAQSIAAADGLLCPSHYLANQAETHFGLPKGTIEVIPLPIGDNEIIERDRDTWKRGSICYVGRLERRKGVLEWIDAAVTIASDYPEVKFDFLGCNCLGTERVSGEQLVESRIPKKMRSRFRFWGAQERSQLSHFLLKARIAVVPSRWENFPNTCVEAMCSGLPVIASPEGGMAEMIVDKRNGWLAPNAHPEGLAETLKRALDTEPDEIARMGQNAARDIRCICDNQAILKRHLEFRTLLARQGVGRSLYLPENLPWCKKAPNASFPRRYSEESKNGGIAVVVSCFHSAHGLDKCLRSVENQTQKPLQVMVLFDEWTEEQAGKIFNDSKRKGWQLIRIEHGCCFTPKNLGITAVLELEIKPTGFVFLSAEDQLQEKFIESALSIFLHCREVGLVSCWVEDLNHRKILNTAPYPSFPFQWLSNELVSFSAIRTEALIEAGMFRKFSWTEYECWDLFNAVMAAGWTAVTLPAVLGKKQNNNFKYCLNPYLSKPHGRMFKEIIDRFPDLIAQDLPELLFLAISSGTYSMNEETFLMRAEMAAMRKKVELTEKSANAEISAMQKTPEITESYFKYPRGVIWKWRCRLNNKLKQKCSLKLYQFLYKLYNKFKLKFSLVFYRLIEKIKNQNQR